MRQLRRALPTDRDSGQGCQFGFFDAKLDKFGFFSRPLASKILFGFLAFFPPEFGFFSRPLASKILFDFLAFFLLNLAFFPMRLISAIIVYLCTISVQNFSISRRKSRLES